MRASYASITTNGRVDTRADCGVGVSVVWSQRVDGGGESLAVPRLAGRWLSVSCAHHHGAYVAQALVEQNRLPGAG